MGDRLQFDTGSLRSGASALEDAVGALAGIEDDLLRQGDAIGPLWAPDAEDKVTAGFRDKYAESTGSLASAFDAVTGSWRGLADSVRISADALDETEQQRARDAGDA